MTSWERESAKKPFCICWYVFVLHCWCCFLEKVLCKNDYQHGHSLQQSFCSSFARKILGHMVYQELLGISERSNIWWKDKQKRNCDKGKYTTNAWGSKRVWGWSKEGLDCFNELFLAVKQDREKDSASVVEDQYKLHCSATKSKKESSLFMMISLFWWQIICMHYCKNKF